MSTELYFMPIPIAPPAAALPELKYILAQYLWGGDGSLKCDKITVGKELIPFLNGIVAATSVDGQAKEALWLIDLINEFGELYLYIT